MIDLDELMLLHDAATPGPWEVTDKCAHLYVTDSNPNREIAKICRKPKAYVENASYIVAACNALPELVARIRELEAQRDWLAGIASHYTDRTNCYNPFAYNGADNACLKDCRDRDCKKCWLVAAKEYTQFSALEPCRIVSNTNSTPPEWLMRRFTEVN